MPYQTFASHASSDRNGSKNLGKFFDRLRVRLKALGTGYHLDDVLFEDYKSIQMGGEWTDSLTDALIHCDSFIFMVSPQFENSGWCGREVAVCLSRHGKWKNQAPQNSKGRFIFPIRWEVNLIRRLATGRPDADIPEVLSKFQHRPPATTSVYDDLGLGQMMAQNKHRERVTIFIDELARAIITGLAHGPLPHHPGIGDFSSVPLPDGWNGYEKNASFDLNYHIGSPQGILWQPSTREPTVAQMIDSCAGLLWLSSKIFDPRTKGRPARIQAVAASNQTFLLVVDATAPPDSMVIALNRSGKPLHLAFILLWPSNSTGADTLGAWLLNHGLAQGEIAESSRRGMAMAVMPANLLSGIEFVLEKAKSLAIKSKAAAPAMDPHAAAVAEQKGLSIDKKALINGPVGKSLPTIS